MELTGAGEAALPDPTRTFRVSLRRRAPGHRRQAAGHAQPSAQPGELGCLANGLLARYPEMAEAGYDARQPGLVNRLDNDTSGLRAGRAQPEAFELLREQLDARARSTRRYLALTARAVAPQRIELPLEPRDRGPRVEVARRSRGSLGRPALTEVVGLPRARGRALRGGGRGLTGLSPPGARTPGGHRRAHLRRHHVRRRARATGTTCTPPASSFVHPVQRPHRRIECPAAQRLASLTELEAGELRSCHELSPPWPIRPLP